MLNSYSTSRAQIPLKEDDEEEEGEVVVVEMEGMEGVMTMDVRKLLLYLRQLVVARRVEGESQLGSQTNTIDDADDVTKHGSVDRRGAAGVLVLLQLELVYEGTTTLPMIAISLFIHTYDTSLFYFD